NTEEAQRISTNGDNIPAPRLQKLCRRLVSCGYLQKPGAAPNAKHSTLSAHFFRKVCAKRLYRFPFYPERRAGSNHLRGQIILRDVRAAVSKTIDVDYSRQESAVARCRRPQRRQANDLGNRATQLSRFDTVRQRCRHRCKNIATMEGGANRIAKIFRVSQVKHFDCD